MGSIIKENISHCHSLYTKCIMNESCLHHVTLNCSKILSSFIILPSVTTLSQL